MKYNYIYNCEIVNIYIYNKGNYINIKKCIYIKKTYFMFYLIVIIYIYSSLIIYIIVNINI